MAAEHPSKRIRQFIRLCFTVGFKARQNSDISFPDRRISDPFPGRRLSDGWHSRHLGIRRHHAPLQPFDRRHIQSVVVFYLSFQCFELLPVKACHNAAFYLIAWTAPTPRPRVSGGTERFGNYYESSTGFDGCARYGGHMTLSGVLLS